MTKEARGRSRAKQFTRKQQGGAGSAATPALDAPVAAPRHVHASRLRVSLVSVALVALTLLVYAPVRHFDFVTFDDPEYVTKNPHVTAGLSWQGVRWALTTGHAANWHPLTWLTHMLDVQFFGLNAGAHHVVNVGLHLASTVLLFGVLNAMTGALGRSAFVAALFAVHPAHVESVAWIAERKDVLSAFFLMLTLWAYLGYVRKPGYARGLAVFGSFALGLMSKPMLVTLPFVLVLLDIWPLQRVSLARKASRSRNGVHGAKLTLSGALFEKAPLLAVSAASSIVTFLVQRTGGAVSGADQLPYAVRLENALVSYVSYAWEMFWPSNLAVIYPYVLTKPAWWVMGSILILTAVSALAVRSVRERPYVLVGWLWYLGTLVPVIGIVQVGIQPMADRYTYVPFIGLFLILAWGATDLLARWRYQRLVIPAVAGVAVAACVVTARAQVQHWTNGYALWEHATKVTESNAHALSPLGDLLKEQGRIDEAIAMYSEALRIEPTFAEAHNKLGVALADQGRTQEAIAQYNEAIRLKPRLAEPRNNLGNALAKLGNVAGAIAQYQEVIRIQPDYADSYNGLGALLADQNKILEAQAQYLQAIRLKPNYAEAHNNLGTALAEQGRSDEAIREFLEAVRIKPDEPDFHYNAAIMLNKVGRSAEAVAHLETAVKLKPGYQTAQQALALLKGR